MSINVSTLSRGPGYVTYGGVNLESRTDLKIPRGTDWKDVITSMFGRVDRVRTGYMIKLPLTLWGAWENLSVIFPSFIMAPATGTNIYGATNSPLVILGTNNDQITLVNAQITKLANLFLGVENDLFAADVEFTALIGRDGSGNLLTPETASSYTTLATGSYVAATEAFSKANFKRRRFLGAWGAITGFTAMAPQKGVAISWDAKLSPVPVDGYGIVDMSVTDLVGSAKCIPLGPTLAQIKTNSQEETAFGTLGSAIAADLVWTGNGGAPVVTLKNAHMTDSETMFGPDPLRVGEVTWKTTTGFTAGARNATGVVA